MSESTRHNDGTLSSLTNQQKQTIVLLSIGTFLEYFDLMLYVHMSVLLNELFFPEADPYASAIYSAFTFCATFIFRPVGALVFGWIGDNVGRKATVVVTTFLMAISCLIMANLPTYQQIGITATYLLVFCRIIQGLSSLAEETGSELYITEMTKPPVQYFLVALINVFTCVGTFFALAVATFSMFTGLNWRYAFWLGLTIGIIGAIARTTLRKTSEFSNAKAKAAEIDNANKLDTNLLQNKTLRQEQVSKKLCLAYFFIQCAWPIVNYFVYIYCINILQYHFNYDAVQVTQHNLYISIIHLLNSIILCYLGYKIYPIKILKTYFMLFIVIIICLPFFLTNLDTVLDLFLLQSMLIVFGPRQSPAIPLFIKSFPVLKRFTYTSFSYALSRAMIYPLTSFGFVLSHKYLGNYGLLIIFSPFCVGYWWGLKYFENLIKASYKN